MQKQSNNKEKELFLPWKKMDKKILKSSPYMEQPNGGISQRPIYCSCQVVIWCEGLRSTITHDRGASGVCHRPEVYF